MQSLCYIVLLCLSVGLPALGLNTGGARLATVRSDGDSVIGSIDEEEQNEVSAAQKCGQDGTGICRCSYGQVYYGKKYVNGKPGKGQTTTWQQLMASSFKEKAAPAVGWTYCNNQHMGGDPAPGYHKWCYCAARWEADAAKEAAAAKKADAARTAAEKAAAEQAPAADNDEEPEAEDASDTTKAEDTNTDESSPEAEDTNTDESSPKAEDTNTDESSPEVADDNCDCPVLECKKIDQCLEWRKSVMAYAYSLCAKGDCGVTDWCIGQAIHAITTGGQNSICTLDHNLHSTVGKCVARMMCKSGSYDHCSSFTGKYNCGQYSQLLLEEDPNRNTSSVVSLSERAQRQRRTGSEDLRELDSNGVGTELDAAVQGKCG